MIRSIWVEGEGGEGRVEGKGGIVGEVDKLDYYNDLIREMNYDN